VKEVVACPEQVCMFARTGDGLFRVMELQEDAKVVTAQSDLPRREGKGLTHRAPCQEHGMHPMEFGPIGIGNTRPNSMARAKCVPWVGKREYCRGQ